jgi:polyisoprenyl-phosphate glycosyltransferase
MHISPPPATFQTPKLLSIILPVYNEEEVIPSLRKKIAALVKTVGVPCEWIFVNDGSSDATEALLELWAAEDTTIKIIHFARNFGHQMAVTAGLDVSAGDVVVIMDGDLQDPPELIVEMLIKYREGYDVVYAQRISRPGETWLKRSTAAFFYWFMKRFVHPRLPRDTGDFRLLSRRVVDHLVGMREGQRFLRGLVAWLGYRDVAIPFERPARELGSTKFNLPKMIKFAFDAIFSFSTLPLRIGVYWGGFVMVSTSFVLAYYLFRKIVFNHLVPGWASLLIVTGILGGSILVLLGLVGIYVGRIYDEIKGRPLYVVKLATNFRQRERLTLQENLKHAKSR